MNPSISRRALLAGTAAAAGVTALGRPARARTDVLLAITHVTLVDGTGAPPLRDATVLVRHGRIVAVGPARRVAVPHDATVVDGSGRHLIPGLADAHAHSSELERVYPPLYVLNGVTTVREMSANPLISALRDRVEAGELFGPRWTIGSRIVDGRPSLWDGLGADIHLSVGTPREARAAVRAEHANGAAFIKTYTRLTRESFRAIADESRRCGIPFLGHCPDLVQAAEASDAGLRTYEHLFNLWYDTSREEERLRREIARVPIGPGEYSAWFARMHPLELRAARTYDRARASRVYERLARNGTAVTPTLVVHRGSDLPHDIPLDDPRYRYVPADVLGWWEWSRQEVYLKERPAGKEAEFRELYARRFPTVLALHEAGVPLLAGTDTGTSYVVPGFALHDELELLVRAGVAPLAALTAATSAPAAYLGTNAGVIAPGRDADLVLLGADPLRDIRNTTRIEGLVVRGRWIDAAERERMLADVRAAAQEPVAPTVLRRACAC